MNDPPHGLLLALTTPLSNVEETETRDEASTDPQLVAKEDGSGFKRGNICYF